MHVNTYGIKIVGKTIMTKVKHPFGEKKYARHHKSMQNLYENFTGEAEVMSFLNERGFFKMSPHDKVLSGYFDIYHDFAQNLVKLRFDCYAVGANIDKPVVGKHKIPRYLYHLTPVKNYEKILQDGVMKPRKNGVIGGLYFFNLQNMINHYGVDGFYRGLGKLFNLFQIKDENELALLRVQVKGLDAAKLNIREYGANIKSKSQTFFTIGDSALNFGLYNKRKMGLEFVFPETVDIKYVQQIGTAKVPLSIDKVVKDDVALDVWKELTKNAPERKAFDVIKLKGKD